MYDPYILKAKPDSAQSSLFPAKLLSEQTRKEKESHIIKIMEYEVHFSLILF